MKRVMIVALCVLGLYSCGQNRPAVIERPVFEISNTTTIEIDKIEMSDSVTVVHISATYGRGSGWIAIDQKTYIRESGSDEKLFFTHAEGINIGERTTIPASETVSFKLFFPPLRPEVIKIDYIEDYPDGGWKILGIHLLSNAKIKFDPIPKDASKTSAEPLPLPEYSTLPARLSGRMLGYVDGLISNEITIYTTNMITGERIETKLPIAEDGSFSGEVNTGMAGIYNTSSIGPLFLVPGKEVKIYTDLKKRSRYQSRYRTDKEPGDSIYTYLSGSYFTSAELNNINQAGFGLFDYQKLMQETVNMKPEEFKLHILGIMNKRIEEIQQRTYSANTRMMMENAIKMQVYTFLGQYEGFINAAYMQVNNIKREDMDKVTFKAEKPGIEYFSYLKGTLNDNMSYLSNYSNIIRLLTQIDYFNIPNGSDKSVKERFAYFKEKSAPVLGTDGILFDLIQAQFYGQQLERMDFFTDVQKQELRDAFRNKPVYAEALIAESDKMKTLLAANSGNKESILNDLPQVSQEKMFDAILAKYKGKVVLVDFWATWCGPCIEANKSILPMKEEMKGKDVVFLYLTGETSPLTTFTRMYPTISGEHYRVSGNQWDYWSKTFGIQGIPTYMIYDRQGKQLSRHLGFPGVDTIRKNIEKGL